MLDKLRNFFSAAPAADDADPEAALHLAAAMLLIEVAKTDHELDDEELARVQDLIGKYNGIEFTRDQARQRIALGTDLGGHEVAE